VGPIQLQQVSIRHPRIWFPSTCGTSNGPTSLQFSQGNHKILEQQWEERASAAIRSRAPKIAPFENCKLVGPLLIHSPTLCRRQFVQSYEIQADHYQFGTAHRQTTKTKTRQQSSTSFSLDEDDDTHGDTNDVLPALKLTSVVVGKERCLFGKVQWC
jgi:hypothetical protein